MRLLDLIKSYYSNLTVQVKTNSHNTNSHNTKAPTPNLAATYCHIINNESHCGYALSTCKNLVREFSGDLIVSQLLL